MNQNFLGHPSPEDQTNKSEISLLDILSFLKRSYKLIGLVSLIGIVVSSGYLLITPKQYEASTQVMMMQIGTYKEKHVYLPGINIEEPNLLISRLSSPASYSVEVAKVCSFDAGKNAQAISSSLVKFTIPKGIANVVDLKVISASPEASVICAQAIFDLIKTTQAQMANSYTEEIKVKLLDYEERLAQAKDLLVRIDKSGSNITVVYLLTRDEINFLLKEIDHLKNLSSTNNIRAARLVSPIYGDDGPIAPKKHLIFIRGLLGGLLLGLIIAFGREFISNIKK